MIDRFIKENTEIDIRNFETTDDLYSRYLKFCRFYNFETVSRRKFAYEIRTLNLGVRHIHKGLPARWGVKLLPCKY